MDQTFLIEFGAILVVAAILGIFARFFKQPLILAYLIAGVLIGPFAFGLIKNPKIIEDLASVGIIFLLFLIGLELNPKKLFEIGHSALVAAFFQIIFSGAFYFAASMLFGFTSTASAYLAIGLTFSSTAIIVTLLSNKNDLDSMHGKLLVGILLVQDFVAIFLLTMISGINSSGETINIFNLSSQIIIKAILLFAVIFLVSKYIFPPVFQKIAKSHELLFLTSLAWCFFLAIVSMVLGFSAEIGAFAAGVSLATLPYSVHVAAKTRPLRDFFLMIFFIYLGTTLVFTNFSTTIAPALVLSLIVMIVNPIVVTIVLSLLGFRKRTSFITGISLTQISEFSFIVIALGVKGNVLPQETITLVSTVAVITVFISTYLISSSQAIYHFFKPLLSLIKTNRQNEDLHNVPEQLSDHIILIGYHRMGTKIFKTLKSLGEKVAVIDYDPRRIRELIDQNEICTYADAIDHEVIQELKLSKAKMIISTIDKIEENRLIYETYKKDNKKLQFIMTAQDNEDSDDLYKMGVDLVIVPSLISGDYLSFLLEKLNKKQVTLEDLKKKELESITNGESGELVRQFVKTETKN
jgi:Kef-type K+ transport system membrane component KefB